jgi:2,5-furandicarboxylate decarboxylase 1
MQRDLRHFLAELERRGLLQRITTPVEPRFELSAVAKGLEKKRKAMLFETVSGYQLPVATNLLGSREMLSVALGTPLDSITQQFAQRLGTPIPPVVVPDGPVHDLVKTGEDASLSLLPIVTHAELDAGPFITAGLIVAKDPETGLRNVSINRMMFKDLRTLGCRMMSPQHLGVIQDKAERVGRPLEIAVSIGNHPCEMICGATSVAFGQDEYAIAGGLRGEPLELVKCVTVDLEVPATAEIVLEGEIVPGVREDEGPFGDFMQNYVPVMKNHVFRLKAITHRRDPIYQTIQASSLEDIHLLAVSREALVYKAVHAMGAKVRAVSLVPSILACAISIEKRFEGEPKNIAAAAFGSYSWLKYCIVVDHDVNVFDVEDVWWALASRSNAADGLLCISNALGFPRDSAGIHKGKLGIDATMPFGYPEEFERKRVPGEEGLDLARYIKEGAASGY